MSSNQQQQRRNYCVICCTRFELEDFNEGLPRRGEHLKGVRKIFLTLCKQFSVTPDVSCRWDFSREPLPFCLRCSKTAIQITNLEEQIGEFRLELDELKECVRERKNSSFAEQLANCDPLADEPLCQICSALLFCSSDEIAPESPLCQNRKLLLILSKHFKTAKPSSWSSSWKEGEPFPMCGACANIARDIVSAQERIEAMRLTMVESVFRLQKKVVLSCNQGMDKVLQLGVGADGLVLEGKATVLRRQAVLNVDYGRLSCGDEGVQVLRKNKRRSGLLNPSVQLKKYKETKSRNGVGGGGGGGGEKKVIEVIELSDDGGDEGEEEDEESSMEEEDIQQFLNLDCWGITSEEQESPSQRLGKPGPLRHRLSNGVAKKGGGVEVKPSVVQGGGRRRPSQVEVIELDSTSSSDGEGDDDGSDSGDKTTIFSDEEEQENRMGDLDSLYSLTGDEEGEEDEGEEYNGEEDEEEEEEKEGAAPPPKPLILIQTLEDSDESDPEFRIKSLKEIDEDSSDYSELSESDDEVVKKQWKAAAKRRGKILAHNLQKARAQNASPPPPPRHLPPHTHPPPPVSALAKVELGKRNGEAKKTQPTANNGHDTTNRTNTVTPLREGEGDGCPVICESCGLVFDGETLLAEHMKESHENEKDDSEDEGGGSELCNKWNGDVAVEPPPESQPAPTPLPPVSSSTSPSPWPPANPLELFGGGEVVKGSGIPIPDLLKECGSSVISSFGNLGTVSWGEWKALILYEGYECVACHLRLKTQQEFFTHAKLKHQQRQQQQWQGGVRRSRREGSEGGEGCRRSKRQRR